MNITIEDRLKPFKEISCILIFSVLEVREKTHLALFRPTAAAFA